MSLLKDLGKELTDLGAPNPTINGNILEVKDKDHTSRFTEKPNGEYDLEMEYSFKPEIPDTMDEQKVADTLDQIYKDVRQQNPTLNIPEQASVKNRTVVVKLNDDSKDVKTIMANHLQFMGRTNQIWDILLVRLGLKQPPSHSCSGCGGCGNP